MDVKTKFSRAIDLVGEADAMILTLGLPKEVYSEVMRDLVTNKVPLAEYAGELISDAIKDEFPGGVKSVPIPEVE